MQPQNNGLEEQELTPNKKGILSVNSRSSSSNLVPKIFFVLSVLATLLIGAVYGFNKYHASSKAAQAAEDQKIKNENKIAPTTSRRTFNTDPPLLPFGARKAEAAEGGLCADGTPGTVMIGQDGKPMKSADGTPMSVCKDGRLVVPALTGQPIPLAGNQPGQPAKSGEKPPSRYAGDVILASARSNNAGAIGGQQPLNLNDPVTALAMQTLNNIGAQGGQPSPPQFAANNNPGSTDSGEGGNPPGSLGSHLRPSRTSMVSATMLGDRNMILPKGRTIDCALSMRLVSEVAGMASCVLSQNVYSDNGRVVLLERGSEATGEYASAMAQGQRRLFVLWTRIKSPSGVIINVNSPAADALGTSGLDGYIDNHWWDRIGAAFMLSLVQDAISYATAATTGGGGGQSLGIFQSTSESGNRMAEKVLESTINIKPTLYRNQGTRGTIYVARDLDFGSVYALHAR